MNGTASETLDPRIRRTRHLLQQALEDLLKEKEIDRISVQEIADAATVNRVTFYDHYPDKFALLECLVARRFDELLERRNIRFDGCASALPSIVLCVCDYLRERPGIHSDDARPIDAYLESAVIAAIRRMIMEGLSRHPPAIQAPMGMTAATLSWAIYGAAREWVLTPNGGSSEEILETIVTLVSPLFAALY
jgi:AcrR family transcriptional regulator